MSFYKTGTLTLTNGSNVVSGAGTSWVDVGTLNGGDALYAPDGKLYEINTFGSNTGLTLVGNYLGSTVSGAAYNIIPIGLLPSALAMQVKSVLTTANAALASAVLSTAAQGLTTTQQANARANIAALCAADVGQGSQSISVAGNTNVTLTAAQAAAQFLTFTGALTGNITVNVPAAVRLFFPYNNTSGAYTLTFAATGGTGLVVTQGQRTMLECDGTNVVNPFTVELGNEAVVGSLTVSNGITSTAAANAFGASSFFGSVTTQPTSSAHYSTSNIIFKDAAGANPVGVLSIGAALYIGNVTSDAEYMRVTSAGAAVTGTLSASGNVTLNSANVNVIVGNSADSGAFTTPSSGAYLKVYGATHATKANQMDLVAASGINALNNLTVTGVLGSSSWLQQNGVNLLFSAIGMGFFLQAPDTGATPLNIRGSTGVSWATVGSTGTAIAGALSATSSVTVGAGSVVGRLQSTNDSSGALYGVYLNETMAGSTSTLTVRIDRNGTQVGSIATTNVATSYATSSDYRLKNNQAVLTDSGTFIDALQPKTWDWAQDGSKGAGFIAHEFAIVCPSAVSGEKDAVDADGKPIYQAMQASTPEVMANIVAEIQSLRRRAATLEASIH